MKFIIIKNIPKAFKEVKMSFWTVVFIISIGSIFLFSPIGRAVADSIRSDSAKNNNNSNQLREVYIKLNEQESEIEEMKNEITNLKESVRFLERLVREQV
jgi:uncharacterized membrane protein